MAHFAHIDKNSIVDRVITVADHDLDFIPRTFPDPENWIQTSYNTEKGVHKLGGTPLRMNYAGIGYFYDKNLDAFIPPKECESFIFDISIAQYVPPKKMPKDGKKYLWDESKIDWAIAKEVEIDQPAEEKIV